MNLPLPVKHPPWLLKTANPCTNFCLLAIAVSFFFQRYYVIIPILKSFGWFVSNRHHQINQASSQHLHVMWDGGGEMKTFVKNFCLFFSCLIVLILISYTYKTKIRTKFRRTILSLVVVILSFK